MPRIDAPGITEAPERKPTVEEAQAAVLRADKNDHAALRASVDALREAKTSGHNARIDTLIAKVTAVLVVDLGADPAAAVAALETYKQ